MIDILPIYFGDPIKIDEFITIKQPTIGQILEFGEKKFWQVANQLCANPTSMRLALWEVGIDWNKISDFNLFAMLSQNLTEEQTALFFEGINFTEFVPIEAESEDGENKMLLINKNNPEIQIDEALYTKMIEYLRVILGIHPKVEKTKSKATKEAIIYEEQMAVKNEQRKHKNDKWDTSLLFPLISACLNHPGFKYKKNELREVGIFEFMDCVKRLQIYENTTSFMTGMYMGMMDTKKLDLNKELNWARDIYSD